MSEYCRQVSIPLVVFARRAGDDREMAELVARFVAAFVRGLEGELAAMRANAPATRIELCACEELGGLRFRFALTDTARIVAGTACTLVTPRGDQPATIERATGRTVIVVATRPIDPTQPCALTVAPWFLVERLVEALRRICDAPLALTLFGKRPAARTTTALVRDHSALDPTQRAAVQLCADSELAFVWGPPGTGKTATLVHILDELLARGERILLASTTNAAIDQVLAKLAGRPWFVPGVFVRIGTSDAETFGTEIAEVVARVDNARDTALARMRARLGDVELKLRYARALADELAPALATQQSLFAPASPRLSVRALAAAFTAADAIAALDARAQQRVVADRIARLQRVRGLARARIIELGTANRDAEARVVGEARVVLCTLTATYLSPLLVGQRFDALIAEEAGMAILPALFHAASRCDRRAIVVGDPRQLPPIVQSDDALVRRAIGRNIFDVTVPDPDRADTVAMLGVQYRMHPAIGGLVGGLFYGGRLVHRAPDSDAIAARPPYPGRAIVVVDTPSTCERAPTGSSRVNVTSAAVTSEIAVAAVRGGAASVAVITPYTAQVGAIRQLFAAAGIGEVAECSTIHRFQGRECDVVILDLADAHPMPPSALVGDAPNLLNVSISRARGKLVIVADVAYFEAVAPDGLVATLIRAARTIQS
jgi:hypothetical protein